MEESDAIVKKHLSTLEQKHDVVILFAVCAGSRQWGLASETSDYDVRFVFRQKEPHLYTSFEVIGQPYKDTIHWESDDQKYDVTGWDLPKFLRHALTMNVSIVEWCKSPIVYANNWNTEGHRLKNQVVEYVDKFADPTELLPAYKGMLLSKKATGTENIKRACNLARLLMVTDVLQSGPLPASFSWDYLLEGARWSDKEKKLLTILAQKKRSGMSEETVGEEISCVLQQHVSSIRAASNDMKVQDLQQQQETKDQGVARKQFLQRIWYEWL